MTSSGGSGTRTMRVAVRAEQVRTLYRQSPWVTFANPLNTIIIDAVLWSETSHALLIAWTALMLACTAARVALKQRYVARAPADEQARRWGVWFAVGAAATGLLWGFGGAFLCDARNVGSEMLVLFVIAGMSAGAVGTLAPYMPAFTGYAMSALV